MPEKGDQSENLFNLSLINNYKRKTVKVKDVTFANIEKIIALIEQYSQLANMDGKYVTIAGSILDAKIKGVRLRKIKTKKTYFKLFNKLLSELCEPVIKVRKIDQLLEVSNTLNEEIQYDDIKSKLDKSKEEYEKGKLEKNGKSMNKNDFYSWRINSYYGALISVSGFIPYRDFLEIPFLWFNDMIDKIKDRYVKMQHEVANIMMACSGFTDGKAFKRIVEDYEREIRQIKGDHYNSKSFAEAKKDLKKEA